MKRPNATAPTLLAALLALLAPAGRAGLAGRDRGVAGPGRAAAGAAQPGPAHGRAREGDLRGGARLPPELGQALAADLNAGELRPATARRAGGARARRRSTSSSEQRVSEGVVQLGALLRMPADLSDPVLTGGPEGYPAGVTREYYAFVEASLDKIPVVLDDPPALQAAAPRPAALLARAPRPQPRRQSASSAPSSSSGGAWSTIARIDYRSPVFGVASLSYSRAVTAIAATWLAVWREARGDLTRMPEPGTRPIRSDAPPIPGAARAPQTATREQQ